MNMEFIMQIASEAMITSAKIAGPILGAGLLAGLIVAIFQAVTQIHEMTLTFIPKILASALAVAIFFDFMMRSLIDFTVRVMTVFPTIIR